jgi:hypothetical protein
MILISTGLLRDAAAQADHAGSGELPGRLQVEWWNGYSSASSPSIGLWRNSASLTPAAKPLKCSNLNRIGCITGKPVS